MMAPVGGRRRRAPVATFLVLGLLVASVYGLYNFLFRPGKLAIEVVPQDAVVRLDGESVKGPPYHVQKPPGSYNLSFNKDGYSKYEQTVEIRAGESERIRVHLEPSADTGFELTSDPPGQLVWMDGQPFTGSDPAGPQARTDFKATRVPPGRHVLEIQRRPAVQALAPRVLPGAGTHPGDPRDPGPGGPRAAAPRPSPARRRSCRSRRPPPTAAPTAPPPRRATASAGHARVDAAWHTWINDAVHRAEAALPPTPPSRRRPARRRPGRRARPSSPPRHRWRSRPAETPPPAPRPASCTVTIGSKPWSEVWIDGRNTGKLTPLVDHRVPCGRRKITLKNPDLQIEKTETVTVRSGEKFKKIFQLLDEEG